MAGLAIVAASYVPLAIHELTNDFSELRAALDYIAGGGDPATSGSARTPARRGLRVVAWPLVGLITDAPAAAALSLAVVAAIVAWRWRAVDPPGERTAVRWLGLGLAWTALALTVAAPGLAVVIAGLPNDHYHAFADPMVFVLVGLGAGAAASLRSAARPSGSPDLRPVAGARRGGRGRRRWSAGTSPTTRPRSRRTVASPAAAAAAADRVLS